MATEKVKISQLPAAAPLTGEEILPVVQAGVTAKVTTDSLFKLTNVTYQQFSGNGVTTAFTLPYAPLVNKLQVFIGGIYQNQGTYSLTGAVLTFTEPPVAGTNNIEVAIFSAANIGATTSDVVSYIPAGLGVVATTVQTKLRESVSVKDYGAVGDGVADDTAEIQAAIDHAAIAGHGKVFFPRGTYNVSSTITVTSSGIYLHGEGGAIDGNVSLTGGMDAAVSSVPTRIRRTGVSTAAVVRFQPAVDDGSLPPLQGGGISDLMIDGSGIAATGLQVTSVRYGQFLRMSVVRCTSVNTLVDVTAVQTVGNNNSSGFHTWDTCTFSNATVVAGATAKTLVLTGRGLLGNTCFNHFVNCQFSPANNLSHIEMENCDSNTFTHCRWGGALTLHASDTGTFSPKTNGANFGPYDCLARHNVFTNNQGRIISKARLTNPSSQGPSGHNAHSNIAFGYSRENGIALPTIEPYSDFQYWTTGVGLSNNLGGFLMGRAPNVTEIFKLTTAQTVTSGVATKVLFNATGTDFLAGADLANSRIVIPSGVKYARATMHMTWAVNAVGMRAMYLRRGDGFTFAASEKMAIQNSHDTLTSRVFSVSPGDAFEVWVSQFSGGNLDIAQGYTTLLQLEYF